ncbi:MAG: hypothetical protein Q9223_003817 [Gallowayella weberi]
MKQSLALTWRFLSSKLHPPLPLSRRESHKLLILLHDSFNRNLDREYPKALADSDHSPDDHIKSLLQSPLFGSNQAQHPSSPVMESDLSCNPPLVRDILFAVEQPVEHFKQQVAAGKADIESAKFALNNQFKKNFDSAPLHLPDLENGLKGSGIGSLVVNWLWSSGQNERLDFIQDRVFTARLIPFLVAERRYKPVWDWLQRSYTIHRHRNVGPSFQKDTGSMFKSLLQSEVAYGEGLQSAIQMFLMNHKLMTLSSHLPIAVIIATNAPAGAYLIREFASKGASANLEDATIQDLVGSVECWAPDRMIAPLKALIELSHPRSPKTSGALQWIFALDASDGKMAKGHRSLNVSICLKTVEVLLAQNSRKEAARVSKVLKTLFAPEVGPDEERRDSDEEEKFISKSLNLLLSA